MQIFAFVLLYLTRNAVDGRRVRQESSSLQYVDEGGQKQEVYDKDALHARQERSHPLFSSSRRDRARHHILPNGLSSLFYSFLPDVHSLSGRTAGCSGRFPENIPRHRRVVAASIAETTTSQIAKPEIREVLRDLNDDFEQIMHREPDWSYFADDFAIVDRRGLKIREGEGLDNVKLLLQQLRQERSKFMSRDLIRFNEQGSQTRTGWCSALWQVRLSSVSHPSWDIDQNATVNISVMTSFHLNKVGKIDLMRIDSSSVNGKEYKLLSNKMFERELADDSDSDDSDTSFTSVARWPTLKLYTFGECAFSFNRTEERIKFQGFRILYDRDPVPTVLGQAIGFSHDTMVPLVNFTTPIPEENRIEEDVQIIIDDANGCDLGEEDESEEDERTPSLVAASHARPTVLDKFLSFFKDRDKLDEIALDIDEENGLDEDSSNESSLRRPRVVLPLLRIAYNKANSDRKAVLAALANRSLRLGGRTNSSAPVSRLLAIATERIDRRVRKFPKQAFDKLFDPEARKHHSMDTYVKLARRRFVQNTEGKAKENRQMYRMALLTQRISSLDADDTEQIQLAVDSLNKEMNPRRPRRRLFDSLEPVRSLKFFTKSRNLSRAINNRLRYETIGPRGIAHNVHLLKEGSNGYLCFAGTKNLGTWFDVHFQAKRYDPAAQPIPLADTADDGRWETIEPGYLYDCHTGFCGSLKALVSDEQFPLLAKEIAGLRSLSVVGHSFGGSLASLLVMSAHAVKELQKIEFNLWRNIPILRRFWSKADSSKVKKTQKTASILNLDQDTIIEDLNFEQKASLQAALQVVRQLSEDELKRSDWDIRMIEKVDLRNLISLCNEVSINPRGSKTRLFLRMKNFMLSYQSRRTLEQKRQMRTVLQLDNTISDEDLAGFAWEINLVSSMNKGHAKKLCKERGLPVSGTKAELFLRLKNNMTDVEDLSIQQRKSLCTGLKLDDKVSEKDLTKLDWEVAIISATTGKELLRCCREHGLPTTGSKADMLMRIKRFVLEAVQKKNNKLKKEFRSDLDLCDKVSDVDLASINWDINIIDMCRKQDLQKLCKQQCLSQKGSKSDLFLRLKDFMYQVGRFTDF